MFCPNCGLANDNAARFCANCGTSFSSEPVSYPPQVPVAGNNSMAKNIGVGCLIAIAIVFFVGLSCTRACFGLRRHSYIQRRF